MPGCKNCRDANDTTCPDIVPSSCVPWQGQVDEELEICLGDSLTYVNNIIIDKIKLFLKGRGIIFEDDDLDLEDCTFVNDILDDEEKNLINILNSYKTAICELKELNDITTADMAAFSELSLYTLDCLDLVPDPCGAGTGFKELIQAIITKLCALNTQFESIADTILEVIEEGTGNFLIGGGVKSCGNNGISYSGAGATGAVTIQALVPPNCPILYLGSTSLFDNSGAGLPNSAYCGWFLCNGNNGTPNSTTLPQNDANTLKYIIRFT